MQGYSARLREKGTTLQSRGVVFAAVALCLALGACGPKQTLEQAIQCDAFKRLPDGTWSASKDVTLDYESNGTHYQTNYDKGAIIKPTASEERDAKDVPKAVTAIIGKIEPQTPALLAALDKKCAAKQ